MARRVEIRRGRSNVHQMEVFVRNIYDTILKGHIDDLVEVAEQIEADALYLVPEDTGKLAASIDVHVSKSPRYPGIIAHASARSRHKPGMGGYAGLDYAPYMEEGEDYDHEKETASAHFLGGPFALHISELFEDLTGKPLRMPKNLQHAAEYIEGNL